MLRVLAVCFACSAGTGLVGAPAWAELNVWPAGVQFRVALGPGIGEGPFSGRLRVHLAPLDARISPDAAPADGPYLDDPLPVVGADLDGWRAGREVSIPGGAGAPTVTFGFLPDGEYRAQAVLDRFSVDSNWRREPGNLFSEVSRVRIEDGRVVEGEEIVLGQVVGERPLPDAEGVRWFSMASTMLSEFRGRDVLHQAGVVLPVGYDGESSYPAVYIVPGFGGDHRGAVYYAAASRSEDAPEYVRELGREAFLIVLDPESGNGHTLFADSQNNGPCGQALVNELVPALEAEFNLIADREARVVRGHSSGGWSAVWLPLLYAEVFGHGFSSAPDPVDFRHFQEASFYNASFYYDRFGELIPSNFDGFEDGEPVWLTTIKQENALEEAWGPGNSSGQQWDSWQGVFAPRDADTGWPAEIWDPVTGDVDRRTRSWFRRLDIYAQTMSNPELLGPIFEERIRIVVGDEDEWSLDDGVRSLKKALEQRRFNLTRGESKGGYMTIVPGATHGSVLASEAAALMYQDMLKVVRAASGRPGAPGD